MTAKKSTSAKKATAKATPAKEATTKSTPAKKATAKATPAKEATTKSTPAKKATTKSTPAKKATVHGGPSTAANSKFFAAARKRAERLTKDPEKLQKIAEESYKTGAARSGPFTAVMDDFRTLIRLVVAYARGHYRDIPTDALVVAVAGLVYVVSPLDLIPDFLPGGFADDAAVVVWVVKTVRSELDNFRAWELGADAAVEDV